MESISASVSLAGVMQARRCTGPGVIVQGGREIKVMCFYEVTTEAGTEWHGEFREAQADKELEPGGARFLSNPNTSRTRSMGGRWPSAEWERRSL